MLTILQGDALTVLRTLPPDSVHCCVTSPPYWGLRDYGVEGQIGLEETPEEYVAKMVAVFAEVRRVLRADGTCWVNMGDSYWGSWANYSGGNRGAGKQRLIKNGSQAQNPVWEGLEGYRPAATFKHASLKPKDLIGMPWRLAFALQADGWYLRQDIIWSKPNPMPESVTDRCTKAHEYIFLLTKSAQYFFDAEAIKEPASGTAHARGNGVNPKANGPNSRMERERMIGKEEHKPKPSNGSVRPKQNASFSAAVRELVPNRNKRSVWTVATAPYSEAHFATFPPDLIKPCILAGTSARGVCPACGAPWERIIELGEPLEEWKKASGADANGEYHGQNTKDYQRHKAQPASTVKERILKGMVERKTIGWQPTCECEPAAPVPAIVLDPFAGSGTTGQVSLERGRKALLIELNPAYVELIRQRTHVTPGLAL